MIKQDWNAIIESKLKDGISIEDLKYKYAEGIELEPNVVDSDLQAYDHEVSIKDPWINMALINEGNSTEKNVLALQALNYGTNGLSITMSPEDDIRTILKDVLTEYLDVRIDCSQLSADELANQKSLLNPDKYPNIRWVSNDEFIAIHISEKTRVNSIKECLQKLDKASGIDVIVSLSKNLLFEIASLRAIRVLLDEYEIQNFNIICTYTVEGSNELGDYNLIEKTYKIISGILGGCNAILTEFKGDENSRLTLNIQNVLDLESNMKSVMDPLKGSYYLEKLTGEIIRQVKMDA